MQPGTWLFVLPWDLHHPGGVNQVVQNLYDANVRGLGNRSLLWIKSWADKRPRVVLVDGRRTVYGRCRGPLEASRPLRNAFAFAVDFPAALLRIRRLIHEEGVVCINVHYPDLDALIWRAMRDFFRHRPRLILSFHGADLTAAAATTGVARRLWHRLLRGADEIVVCSEQLRADFERSFGEFPHLRVIDNGVDPELIDRSAAGTPPVELPPKYIVSLATFEEKKGIDVLMRAFDLVAEHNPDVHLIVAGRVTGADYFEAIELQRRQLRHGTLVRLLPDLAHGAAMQLLRRAHLLVLASRQEPFGIVVLEAGVLGRPVVATAVCGVAQRLTAGVDLLVAPPADAAALAAAIQRILADNSLASNLAMSLRQRVLTEFTWARIVRQYAAIGATA